MEPVGKPKFVGKPKVGDRLAMTWYEKRTKTVRYLETTVLSFDEDTSAYYVQWFDAPCWHTLRKANWREKQAGYLKDWVVEVHNHENNTEPLWAFLDDVDPLPSPGVPEASDTPEATVAGVRVRKRPDSATPISGSRKRPRGVPEAEASPVDAEDHPEADPQDYPEADPQDYPEDYPEDYPQDDPQDYPQADAQADGTDDDPDTSDDDRPGPSSKLARRHARRREGSGTPSSGPSSGSRKRPRVDPEAFYAHVGQIERMVASLQRQLDEQRMKEVTEPEQKARADALAKSQALAVEASVLERLGKDFMKKRDVAGLSSPSKKRLCLNWTHETGRVCRWTPKARKGAEGAEVASDQRQGPSAVALPVETIEKYRTECTDFFTMYHDTRFTATNLLGSFAVCLACLLRYHHKFGALVNQANTNRQCDNCCAIFSGGTYLRDGQCKNCRPPHNESDDLPAYLGQWLSPLKHTLDHHGMEIEGAHNSFDVGHGFTKVDYMLQVRDKKTKEVLMAVAIEVDTSEHKGYEREIERRRDVATLHRMRSEFGRDCKILLIHFNLSDGGQAAATPRKATPKSKRRQTPPRERWQILKAWVLHLILERVQIPRTTMLYLFYDPEREKNKERNPFTWPLGKGVCGCTSSAPRSANCNWHGAVHMAMVASVARYQRDYSLLPGSLVSDSAVFGPAFGPDARPSDRPRSGDGPREPSVRDV